jgi:hypothetical protein
LRIWDCGMGIVIMMLVKFCSIKSEICNPKLPDSITPDDDIL